jgi:hypothetical protein
MGTKKCIYSTHPPWSPHTYDFVVLTSLTHPRKILLLVLQIGKTKDLSAPTIERPDASGKLEVLIKNYIS